MPKGKGTYGSKVGRPPKNNKVTKMAGGGVKAADFKEPWMKRIIREEGVTKGIELIIEILGGPKTDPETGVTRFGMKRTKKTKTTAAKGGMAMKNGGVKIKGTNVTKPATTKQYQNNLRGAGTSKTNKGKTKAPASYRRGGSARGK